jgi:NTE family protein
MRSYTKPYGLTMSGGGVKGIAYIGVFKASEERRISWGNMAGVSAGSLAIAIKVAGYSAAQMQGIMGTLDFKGIQLTEAERLPVVKSFQSFASKRKNIGEHSIIEFLNQPPKGMRINEPGSYRGNILSNIVTFSNQGALFDGDYLEEWLYDILAKRGIKTFADVRGGICDKANPRGYKIRMTGVDCNRVKNVTLPDDLEYYGIDPDKFEVAKAVRISTCVPFAFKPVVIRRNGVRHYLVDGGVFDTFPYWLIDNTELPAVGFRLVGKKKFFSITTAWDIVKSIIDAVHDIGVPHNNEKKIDYIQDIDTSKVSSLDFNLSDEMKTYLVKSGYYEAHELFANIKPYFLKDYIRRIFRR